MLQLIEAAKAAQLASDAPDVSRANNIPTSQGATHD